MQQQLQHKQFTMRNETLSLSMSYCFVQLNRSIVPIGSENDFIFLRLDYTNT
jgi:hypothetical protein